MFKNNWCWFLINYFDFKQLMFTSLDFKQLILNCMLEVWSWQFKSDWLKCNLILDLLHSMFGPKIIFLLLLPYYSIFLACIILTIWTYYVTVFYINTYLNLISFDLFLNIWEPFFSLFGPAQIQIQDVLDYYTITSC